jgi:hypothetical protein
MEKSAATFDPTASLRVHLTDDDLKSLHMTEVLKARYVGSDRDDRIGNALQELLKNACMRRDPRLPHSADNRVPGIGFSVIGETGAGKSRTLDHIFRNHPAFPGFGVVGSGCPLISIEAPSPCTPQQIAMEILKALNYETDRDLRENKAWRRVRDQLEPNRAMILHIGECQRVMHQPSVFEIKKMADTLIGLMESPTWPVQLILSGVTELENLLEVERQLWRRLAHIKFGNVSAADDGEFVEEAIRDYAKTADLKVRIAADDMLVGRLCHAAVLQFGLVMAVIVDAIKSCLADGHDTLAIGDFANGYTGRTLQPVDKNPFIARAWDTVDCSIIREKFKPPAEESAAATYHKRMGRKGRKR